VQGGLLTQECAAVLQAFFKLRRSQKMNARQP
jgi:hypothetical protein